MSLTAVCAICARNDSHLNPFIYIEEYSGDPLHDECLRNCIAVYRSVDNPSKISRGQMDMVVTAHQIYKSLDKTFLNGDDFKSFLSKDPIKLAALDENFDDLSLMVEMDPVEERFIEALKAAIIADKTRSISYLILNSGKLTKKGIGEAFKFSMSIGNEAASMMLLKEVDFYDQLWGLRNAAKNSHLTLQSAIAYKMHMPEYAKMSAASLTDQALINSAEVCIPQLEGNQDLLS